MKFTPFRSGRAADVWRNTPVSLTATKFSSLQLKRALVVMRFRAEEEEEIGANLDRSPSRFHCIHLFYGGDAATSIRSGPVALEHHQYGPDFPPDRLRVG